MIKILLMIVVVLALIGGAIRFEKSDEDWALIVNKTAALNSVQNGAIRIYDFVMGANFNDDNTDKTPNPDPKIK